MTWVGTLPILDRYLCSVSYETWKEKTFFFYHNRFEILGRYVSRMCLDTS